jgi:hypothetical protein
VRRSLLVIPFIFVAVGCGAKESSLEDSSDAMKDAGSSRIEWRLEGGQELPEFGTYSTRGVVDYSNERGEFVMEKRGVPNTAIEARYIGKDVYFGVALRGKMRWLKNSSAYEASGTDQFLPGPGGASPDELLEKLVKASKKVEVLGQEEIRGVQATLHRAHVDETKLLEEVEGMTPSGALVIDAWIDDYGLARRIRIPFGSKSQAASVVDLFDFGVHVDVEAPAADEILSEEEFGKLMDDECSRISPERPRDAPLGCLMFGGSGSGWTGYGSEEMSPTKTMPRKVEETK